MDKLTCSGQSWQNTMHLGGCNGRHRHEHRPYQANRHSQYRQRGSLTLRLNLLKKYKAPSHCAIAVATAAPAQPMPWPRISHISKTTFSRPTPVNTRSGDKEFCCPRQIPWQTFMIMTAGAARARTDRYANAAGIISALVPIAASMCSPPPMRPAAVTIPQMTANVKL